MNNIKYKINFNSNSYYLIHYPVFTSSNIEVILFVSCNSLHLELEQCDLFIIPK